MKNTHMGQDTFTLLTNTKLYQRSGSPISTAKQATKERAEIKEHPIVLPDAKR